MNAYTHGHHPTVLRSHAWRTAANSAAYLVPHLRPDMRLLDVGAGPGTITADLAGMVASVVATEISADALALSQQTLDERGVSNVSFEVQDVHALDFVDDSFDVVHAHQVLQHVADPVRALREMRRVTRPGGIVAVRDSDYAAFTWFPEVPALTDWLELYRACARANQGEPDAGRRLSTWALEAGFETVTASSSTWCFADPDDREWWAQMWADRMLHSTIAEQAVSQGLATEDDLKTIAEGWSHWSEQPGAWFSVLHGEVLCRA